MASHFPPENQPGTMKGPAKAIRTADVELRRDAKAPARIQADATRRELVARKGRGPLAPAWWVFLARRGRP